jgi:hypothetical protein
MNKLILLISCFLLQASILRGQLKPKNLDQTAYPRPEWIVKTNLLSNIDPFTQTTSIQVERQIPAWHKWHSLEYEFGYTYAIADLTAEAWGYHLRAAYRHYWKKIWKQRHNVYGAIALNRRQFFDSNTAFLWREEQSYQQNLDYKLAISQHALTYNLGVTRYFGSANRFHLDMSVGLGARITSIKFKDLPDDAYIPDAPDFFESNYSRYIGRTTVKNQNYFFHSTTVAIKLGYVFQKNAFSLQK